MTLKLTIGNKNYSSWSMRPWIAMKVAGIGFDETVISLNDPQFKPTLLELSPTGKVPALVDGDVHVWESLAILEYVAEKFPAAKLWPADQGTMLCDMRGRGTNVSCWPDPEANENTDDFRLLGCS